MTKRHADVNFLHQLTRKLATKRPIIGFFSPILHHLDRVVYQWTNGRHTAASIVTGLPIIHLTAIGAKSGQPRTVPLIGSPDGHKFVIIASNWGQKRYPAWYYNVQVNPEVTVSRDGRSATYTAREVSGDERDKYWQLAQQYYWGFAIYAERARHRHIPVLVLTPHNQIDNSN